MHFHDTRLNRSGDETRKNVNLKLHLVENIYQKTPRVGFKEIVENVKKNLPFSLMEKSSYPWKGEYSNDTPIETTDHVTAGIYIPVQASINLHKIRYLDSGGVTKTLSLKFDQSKTLMNRE